MVLKKIINKSFIRNNTLSLLINVLFVASYYICIHSSLSFVMIISIGIDKMVYVMIFTWFFLCIEGKKKIIQKGDYFLWLASLHRRGVQVSSILEGGSETPTYFRNYSFIVVSLHWLVRCGVHQPYVVDTNPIKPRWRRVVGCAIIISLLNDWQKILIIFIELWNEKERGKISAIKILV